MITRDDVVAEARSWLGTPFKHQGRLKLIGCDCVGLIYGVAWALGWQYDNVGTYNHRPHWATMAKELRARLVPIKIDETLEADILLMAFEREPSHLALITDKGIIHAAAMLRRVVEHRLDAVWRSRIRGAYRFKELA